MPSYLVYKKTGHMYEKVIDNCNTQSLNFDSNLQYDVVKEVPVPGGGGEYHASSLNAINIILFNIILGAGEWARDDH